MNKEEKNKAIAKILGFEEYEFSVTQSGEVVDKVKAWKYPTEYRYLQSTMPVYDCPDFIKMIDGMREIENIIKKYK